MSVNDIGKFSWFRDGEQSRPLSAADVSTAELARRPWRAHWPPRSEDDLSIWLRCEFPEVLSWRFDPDEPFDRPWRYWTRTALSKKEEENVQQGLRLLVRNNFKPHRHYLKSTPKNNIDNQIAQMAKVKVDSFLYLAPLELYHTQKPYRSRLPYCSHLKQTNIIEQGYEVEVHNIQGYEHLFTLEKSGFQFLHLPTTTSNWTEDNVRSEYLPNLSKWLKDYFGSEAAFVYSYNLRNNDTNRAKKGPWKPPILRAHCDATARSCANRIKLHFPHREGEIMKRRYRVWRSINGQEIDTPLAFCDYRTVSKDDLVGADMVYPHFCEEGYEILYNPAHRWFYKNGMSTNEVVIFNLDDTLATAAKFTPHAAFMDPSASGDCKRASIEARAIIIG